MRRRRRADATILRPDILDEVRRLRARDETWDGIRDHLRRVYGLEVSRFTIYRRLQEGGST